MDAFRNLLQQVGGFVWAYVKRGLDSVNFEHICEEKLQAGEFGRKKGAWRFYKGKPCFDYIETLIKGFYDCIDERKTEE